MFFLKESLSHSFFLQRFQIRKVGAITNVNKCGSFPVSDPAERNGRYSQVRGDVMLGHSSDDLGMSFKQIVVSFFGRVFDARQKELGIIDKPPEKILVIAVFQVGMAGMEFLKSFSADRYNHRGFDAFDGEQTLLPAYKTFDGGDGLVLEEELNGDVFPVFIEPLTQAAFFDEMDFVGNFSGLQQNRFGCDLPFGKRLPGECSGGLFFS